MYAEAQLLAGAKKLALFTAGAASQKYMNALADQQEVMADLADIIIQVYALESALLASPQAAGAQIAPGRTAVAMVRLYAAKAMDIVELASRRIVAAVAEGDTLRVQLAICRRLAKRQPQDVYAALPRNRPPPNRIRSLDLEQKRRDGNDGQNYKTIAGQMQRRKKLENKARVNGKTERFRGQRHRVIRTDGRTT